MNSSAKVVCCDNVELSSSNVDFVNSAYKNLLIGNWSKLSEEVNNRPVYKKGNYFLAVASGSPGLKPNWVATSTPGSQSGFMFEKNFFAPKCPHAVHQWRYFSQNLLQTEDDDSLAVTCGASENKQESNRILLIIRLISGCSEAAPDPPSGASHDHDGSNNTATGTVVTYNCSQGHRVYVSVS